MAQQEMTPEQQEELRKKLENMSPEELREFQKKQCIFCHIVSGKVAAKKVYEDEKVLGILDINPANPGHILLMPKEHYMIMPQMPDNELSYIFMITKQLSNAVLKALDVRGTNILVANGAAAGQRAQHFMLHIIPRKEGDGVAFNLPSKQYSDDELNTVAAAVRKRLSELIVVKEKPKTAQDIIKEKLGPKEEKKIVDAEIVEEKKTEKAMPRQEQLVVKKDENIEQEKTKEVVKETKPQEEPKETKQPKKPDDKPSATPAKPKRPTDDDDDGEIDLDAIARMLNG